MYNAFDRELQRLPRDNLEDEISLIEYSNPIAAFREAKVGTLPTLLSCREELASL